MSNIFRSLDPSNVEVGVNDVGNGFRSVIRSVIDTTKGIAKFKDEFSNIENQ